LEFRHSRENEVSVKANLQVMPQLKRESNSRRGRCREFAPAGDLLSCSRKKVGKEALPAAPALRATLAAEGPPGRSLN
jgi:hypothetical protein